MRFTSPVRWHNCKGCGTQALVCLKCKICEGCHRGLVCVGKKIKGNNIACTYCGVIHRKSIKRCLTCRKCKELCLCRHRPSSEMIVKKEPTKTVGCTASTQEFGKKVYKVQNIINPLARRVGMELEFGARPRVSNSGEAGGVHYKWVRDGSLGVDDATELVICPTSGDQLVETVRRIGYKIPFGMCKVTAACGFHVHVDGSDLSYWDIRSVWGAWLKYQENLYELIPFRRRDTSGEGVGHYARKYELGVYNKLKLARNKDKIMEVLLGTLYGIGRSRASIEQQQDKFDRNSVKRHKNERYGGGRYYGLNLHSWYYRGSLEFRIQGGHKDPEFIWKWAAFCGWFVEIAKGIGFDKIHDIPFHQFLREPLKSCIKVRNKEGKLEVRSGIPQDIVEFVEELGGRRDDSKYLEEVTRMDRTQDMMGPPTPSCSCDSCQGLIEEEYDEEDNDYDETEEDNA